MDDDGYEEVRKRYLEKLRGTLHEDESSELHTRQYEEFRQEYLPKPLSFYEKACRASGSIISVKTDPKKAEPLRKAIDTCHLNVTPDQVTSLSLTVPIAVILASVILFLGVPYLMGRNPSLFLTFYGAVAGLVLMIPLSKIPFFIANSWRMKAGNQMVLCIFYVVTYMRHTSNLELAIDFAAEHLNPPLSLDMKKIIWNLETEKYDSLKESLDAYLENWHGTNEEFVESMHLIESSLVESSEVRRIEALEKSLSVMLEETYEKMLHYAHNLKGPLTTLHMLGIILPILGLVILPLLVSFMPEAKWYHLFAFYNITLPALVYFLGRDILSKRPSSYGGSDVEEKAAAAGSTVKIGGHVVTALFVATAVIVTFFLVGFLPILMHVANPEFDLVNFRGKPPEELSCFLGFCAVPDVYDEKITERAQYYFNEYREVTYKKGEETISVIAGPFGIVATLLSLLVPLGLGLGVGLYYRLRSRGTMELRKNAKRLELEFSSALFQLGNRLADGLPLEIAFSKVAAVLPETASGEFFQLVSANITKLGLSVDDAIFHEKYGALNRYPSNIIESSMKVLVQSARKGPLIASQAIINVANYIKEMHRVDERLKDLMADVISSMESQIKFLTPTIAGVVMGITSMIMAILGKLSQKVGALQSDVGSVPGGGASGLLGAFSGSTVGTFWFQLVVGLYVVEIVYVLSILVNGIENGPDKASERAALGNNMIRSTMTYVLLTFAVVLLFNMVAVSIVPE